MAPMPFAFWTETKVKGVQFMHKVRKEATGKEDAQPVNYTQGFIGAYLLVEALKKAGNKSPFLTGTTGPVICSYQFAKSKANDIKEIEWDLVVLDEAHRLRNVYKTSNVIAKTLKDALGHVHSKVLLTATPLQNSLLELYGLVSMIDDRVFGDLDSFRTQFIAQSREQAFQGLRQRLATVCKRTLRRQVQP